MSRIDLCLLMARLPRLSLQLRSLRAGQVEALVCRRNGRSTIVLMVEAQPEQLPGKLLDQLIHNTPLLPSERRELETYCNEVL